MFRGEERDGGLIYRNQKPTSEKAPHWKGKIYLKGIGWYWVSGWVQGTESNPYISLRTTEMTDEQALQYCKPKPAGAGKPANQPRPN